ncbi:nudix domain-containing protein [Diaporthe sp. PMI_573]|nr:nudix domain-containing protein [Diaporthaceae sp. PMI_573]
MQSAMATSSNSNPRVGVAAVIQGPDGKVVFGRRKSSHGAGQWAFPGGHLEYGEDFKQCAERETLEETGLKVKGRKIAHVTNDVFSDLGKHYITIFVLCEMLDQGAQPALLEPEKCEEWVWKTFDEIKQVRSHELFLPIQHLLKEISSFDRFLNLDA